MKKLNYVLPILVSTLVVWGSVRAISCLPGQQGGTGICSVGVTDIGKVLTVSSTSPLQYALVTVSSSGGTATTTIAGLTASNFILKPTSTLGISTTSPNTIWFGPDQVYATSSLILGLQQAASSTINLKIGPFTFSSSSQISVSSTNSIFQWYFATNTVSQFLNDVGYATSSISVPVSYANGGTATTTAWTKTAVLFAGDSSVDQSYTPSASSFVFSKANASVGIRDNRAYALSSSTDLFSTALHVNGRGLFSGGRPESLDGSPAGAVIGYLKASDYAFLDGYQSGVGSKNLVLQPSGGGLGVGGDPISGIKLGIRVDQANPGMSGSQIALGSKTGTTTALMAFGYTRGTDPYGAGYLQGEDPGNAFVNLLLEPRGGKVGIGTGTSAAPTTILEVVGDTLARSSGTNTKPLVVKGFAGQTANLTQWQDSTSTVLSVVDKNGRFGIGTSAPTSTLQVGTPSDSTNDYFQFDNATSTPAAGDCTAGSKGRAIFFATSTLANEKLYICGVDASNVPTWTSAVFN